MAEFNAFSIGIGADITILQTELQRAKNLLVQFESASKKALTVGELNYSNSQIANLKSSISQLNQEIGKTGKPVGDATQSLVNFSRIAQDAPYGIIGIANNLNPMVESFQRLATTEGGTKKAFEAMLSGLTGPAGIGVALGMVSSLAVVYSKEITEFFKGPIEELEKFRVELKKVSDDINKSIGQEQTKRTKGILLTELIVGGNATQQEEALKQLKSLYKESDAIKNAKLGQDQSYYTKLVETAAKQGGAVANEKNFTSQLDLLYTKQIENNKKRNAELDKITGVKQGSGLDFNKVISVESQKAAINKTFDILGDEIKKDITKLELLTRKELKKVTSVSTPDGTETKDKVSEVQKSLNSLKTEINSAEFKLLNNLITEKGGKDSYAVTVLEAIDKTIDKIAGSKTTEAVNALKKLMAQKGQLEEQFYGGKPTATNLDTSNVFKEPTELKTGAGEKALDPLRTLRNYYSIKRELSVIDLNNSRAKDKEENKLLEQQQKRYERFANTVANDVTNALSGMWDAMQKGENVLDSLGNMLGKLAEQLVAAALQAAIFAGIMSIINPASAASGTGMSFLGYFSKALGFADGGIVTGPTHALIGEGNESEAVMPLSKLGNMMNNTFNAGAMSGGGGQQNGSFVLKGNDLVLALQRSNYSLNLRRGA